MGSKRVHDDISPLVDDDIAEISPPSIFLKRMAAEKNFSELGGEFFLNVLFCFFLFFLNERERERKKGRGAKERGRFGKREFGKTF